MDLRLCDGHHRGWPEVEGDAYRGRVQPGVSGARGGALDHRRGRAQHPEQAVHAARRARLHPLGNGPEFIAKALRKWLAASGVKTLYIEPPDALRENTYSETFISRLRD